MEEVTGVTLGQREMALVLDIRGGGEGARLAVTSPGSVPTKHPRRRKLPLKKIMIDEQQSDDKWEGSKDKQQQFGE